MSEVPMSEVRLKPDATGGYVVSGFSRTSPSAWKGHAPHAIQILNDWASRMAWATAPTALGTLN